MELASLFMWKKEVQSGLARSKMSSMMCTSLLGGLHLLEAHLSHLPWSSQRPVLIANNSASLIEHRPTGPKKDKIHSRVLSKWHRRSPPPWITYYTTIKVWFEETLRREKPSDYRSRARRVRNGNLDPTPHNQGHRNVSKLEKDRCPGSYKKFHLIRQFTCQSELTFKAPSIAFLPNQPNYDKKEAFHISRLPVEHTSTFQTS